MNGKEQTVSKILFNDQRADNYYNKFCNLKLI